jgi:hypothetical protein
MPLVGQGVASADNTGVKGVSAGLRETTVSLIQGTAVAIPAAAPVPPTATGRLGTPPPQLDTNGSIRPSRSDAGPAPPAPHPGSIALGVSLAGTVVLSTDATTTAAAVALKNSLYRAKEAATLVRTCIR